MKFLLIWSRTRSENGAVEMTTLSHFWRSSGT
jgi:hypothetical protein